jgi:hypothetical protein
LKLLKNCYQIGHSESVEVLEYRSVG